jgi:hypothetical protein
MEIFLFWAVFCVLLAVWANNWGRSGAGYFFFALLCSPLIAGLVLLVSGKKTEAIERAQIVAGEMKKCPFCAELIKIEAVKCRFCGSELQSSRMS